MFGTTVLLDNLKTALSLAQHGVSSRAQLPILLNFLLESKKEGLFVSSTDLELGIKIKIPAKIESEGETTVSAKTFLDFLSNISAEKITLKQTGSTLELVTKKVHSKFPTIPAPEFPKLYQIKGNLAGEFKKEDFDKQVSRVVFAASLDSGRPALSGLLIKPEEKGISLVATDGYRLSLKEGFSESANKGIGQLLLPARVLKELINIKDQGAIKLFTSEENNQVVFEIGDAILVGRLIEAEYPEYNKIIPQDFGTRATFGREEAASAVRACSVIAREAANVVKMVIGKDKVVFSSSASSVGENEIEVEAKVEGEENEIAFNTRYLLDFFSSVDEDDVVLEMIGPLSPGVFRLGKDRDFLHLIMPIRVQG